jgi:hypothetical protein
MSVKEMQKSKHLVKLSYRGVVPLVKEVGILKTQNEVSLKKLLYGFGVFIFGGLVLTIMTNPLPSMEKTKEFLLFIFGSFLIYYFLVHVYFRGGLWSKVFYIILSLLWGISICMAIYLAANSNPH